MIKIKIQKSDNCIKKIIITGHANYDEHGKDIVCASVSSIAITSVNLILRMDDKAINVKQSDGLLEIDVLKHDANIEVVLENMLDMLEELSKDYEKNVKII